jgi:hypothetical protein
MKYGKLHIVILISLLWGGPKAFAQPLADSELLRSPLFKERFYLHTDRNVYGAGDPVRFRIFNLSPYLLKENKWSTVIYVELVNSRHTPVVQSKFQLDPEGSRGELLIPDTLSTGNYLLRAYTMWMRNFPASEYVYVPLAVVNPARLEPFDGLVNREEADSLKKGEELEEMYSREGGGVECRSDREIVGKRENVTLTIRSSVSGKATGGMAVSVLKKGYQLPEGRCYSGKAGGIRQVTDKIRFIPETRGISISGKIVQGEDQHPVPFAMMNLTLLGSEPDYIGFVSDQQGNIRMAIPPHTGARNALISFDTRGDEPYELLLEEAFSKDYPEETVPHYSDLMHTMDVLEEFLLLEQLNDAFGAAAQEVQIIRDTIDPVYFYGTPDYRYLTGDYVSLPNLEEFFFELIPQVRIGKYKGEYQVTVMDDAESVLDYTPLILLDHVAIRDMDALLRIDPRSVRFIDIINHNYIRGGNYYGGIISIISREGNLAGVNLPEGSTIIDLQTYQDSGEDLPQAFASYSGMERIPDLRTLLYWEPWMQLPAGEEVVVEFQTSDVAGTYVVLLEGMDEQGVMIRETCEFVVK